MQMIRIISFRIENFCIPLSPPLIVETGATLFQFHQRRGMYLVLTGSVERINFRGIGETVEPVFTSTGMSSCAIFENACRSIEEHAARLVGAFIHISDWISFVRAWIDVLRSKNKQVESLTRYAFEQSLLTLLSESLGLPLHAILRSYLFPDANLADGETHTIKINTFFNSRATDDTCSKVASHQSACMKVKVGSKDPGKDALLLRQVVQSILDNNAKFLRLDANRMWGIDETVRFLHSIDPATRSSIEYIEEPFHSSSVSELRDGLKILKSKCEDGSHGVFIALDESLLHENIESLLAEDINLRIVHKTSLHSLRANELLERYSKRTTISCTFESGVGLAFLCSVAAAVNPRAFHGIHPLHAMVHADATTKIFFDLTKKVDGETFVYLGELCSVREYALALLDVTGE